MRSPHRKPALWVDQSVTRKLAVVDIESSTYIRDGLANLKAKVNLIALNPGPGIPYEMPEPERVLAFQAIVRRAVPCFIHRPRGRDIYAACGQLKRVVLAKQQSQQPGDGLPVSSPQAAS